MIRFACPTCNGVISTSSKKAGTVKACPGCGQMVQVPDAAAFKQDKPARKKAAAGGAKPATAARRGGGLRAFWALVRMSLWGLCFGAIILGVVDYLGNYANAFDNTAKITVAVRTLVWTVGPFYIARTFESSSKSFEELIRCFRHKA